jgi:uncharacterized protein YbjT (DUF2867 family)
MKVFVAGASGAIGRRLVPQLIDAGHEVIGSHSSPASAELIRSLGAEPVALDLLDAGAVRKAVLDSKAGAIIHQATALANLRFGRNLVSRMCSAVARGPGTAAEHPARSAVASLGSWA